MKLGLRSDTGATLIEIIVSIVIIGVGAAWVIESIASGQWTFQRAVVTQELREFAWAKATEFELGIETATSGTVEQEAGSAERSIYWEFVQEGASEPWLLRVHKGQATFQTPVVRKIR